MVSIEETLYNLWGGSTESRALLQVVSSLPDGPTTYLETICGALDFMLTYLALF
jgi:hypothetical protein